MLLKQSPSEVDLVAEIFYLTTGEKQLLLSANVGEGLFFAGQSHVAMQIIAAPFEHKMITSNPEEMEKAKKAKVQNELEEAEDVQRRKNLAKEVEKKEQPKELPDPYPDTKEKPKIILD